MPNPALVDRARAILAIKASNDPNATKILVALETALQSEVAVEKAHDIAFHLTDWHSDGILLLALQLAPSDFTLEETQEIIRGFLLHAPNHIAEAARLYGFPVEPTFNDDQQDS